MKNKKVEEFIERVRLTDEGIDEAWPNTPLIQLEGISMSGKQIEQLACEVKRCVKIVAEAQLNKVLNDDDLALIDREKEILVHPDKFCDCDECTIARAVKLGCFFGIPLAEALKESDETKSS